MLAGVLAKPRSCALGGIWRLPDLCSATPFLLMHRNGLTENHVIVNFLSPAQAGPALTCELIHLSQLKDLALLS